MREAELLADLEQMCARDRAKMETQVEAFQVCVCAYESVSLCVEGCIWVVVADVQEEKEEEVLVCLKVWVCVKRG